MPLAVDARERNDADLSYNLVVGYLASDQGTTPPGLEVDAAEVAALPIDWNSRFRPAARPRELDVYDASIEALFPPLDSPTAVRPAVTSRTAGQSERCPSSFTKTRHSPSSSSSTSSWSPSCKTWSGVDRSAPRHRVSVPWRHGWVKLEQPQDPPYLWPRASVQW